MQNVLISRCIAVCHWLFLIFTEKLSWWKYLVLSCGDRGNRENTNQAKSLFVSSFCIWRERDSSSYFRPSYSLTACNTLRIGTTVNSGYKCPVGKTFLFFLFFFFLCAVLFIQRKRRIQVQQGTFFQLLIILMYRRCSLMIITITARTCKMWTSPLTWSPFRPSKLQRFSLLMPLTKTVEWMGRSDTRQAAL